MNSRARSKAALENDRRILAAALAEANAAGVDGLGFGAVAARAGVTTGALYSRFADAGDLTAVLWQEKLRQSVINFLTETVKTFLEQPGTCGDMLVERVKKMSVAEKVGLEAVMIAPRFPQLDEVLGDDVQGVLTGLKSAPDGGVPTVRTVMALSTVLGCVTQRFVYPDTASWSDVMNVVSLACALAKPAPGGSKKSPAVEPLQAVSDSPLRDVLFNSVADVVARSGVEAATVARIARRARMTSGALYTLYDSRDDLMLDAMEHMLGLAVADAADIVREGEDAGDVVTATARLLRLSSTPTRRQWRRFRLETYVAARTNRKVASVLRRLQREGDRRYEMLFAANPDMTPRIVAMLSRAGQNQPVGMSVVEPYVPGLASFDFRPYTAALLEVRSRL